MKNEFLTSCNTLNCLIKSAPSNGIHRERHHSLLQQQWTMSTITLALSDVGEQRGRMEVANTRSKTSSSQSAPVLIACSCLYSCTKAQYNQQVYIHRLLVQGLGKVLFLPPTIHANGYASFHYSSFFNFNMQRKLSNIHIITKYIWNVRNN